MAATKKKPLLKLDDILPLDVPSKEELAKQQETAPEDPEQGVQAPPAAAGAVPAAQQQGNLYTQQDVAPAEGESGEAADESGPTPQEQEAYDRVMLAAGELIFEDEQYHQSLIGKLKHLAKNPAQALATASIELIQGLEEKVRKQQQAIPLSALPHVACEIVEQIGELANKAVFPVDQNILGKAGQMVLAWVVETYGVNLTQQDVAALMEQFSEDEVKAAHDEQDAYMQSGAQQPAQGAPAGAPV